RDARVEIPAVVIEPRGIGDSAHAVQIFLFELAEADDDIGHLHAGVLDVVLHFDRYAAKSLNADERVAKRGVAQMPDVRGCVGIDRRVLDDGLARRGGSKRTRPTCAIGYLST